MTLENKAAYSTTAPGLCRYTNVRAYVFGAIQFILGIMSVGCGVVVTVCQGLGWMVFIGIWGGTIFLASGVFSVKASIKKDVKIVKIAMCLGIAAFVVSLGTFFLGVIGLYMDGVDNSLMRRIDTALSSGVHVVNVFVGIWGMLVTLFFVGSAWPYVVGTAPFVNVVGPDMDPLTHPGGVAPPGKLTKEEAAAEKKRKKQEEKERKQREKEEKERKKREEQEAKKKKKEEEEAAKRKQKEEELKKKGAAAGAAAGGAAGSRRASRRHPSADEEPDSDFEYDSDEFDDDEDVIEGETAEERKKRRRQKAWQLHIKKRYITGKDPFSKDRVYNKTWEKEPKEEFKENKTMELRRKMLEAKMKKK